MLGSGPPARPPRSGSDQPPRPPRPGSDQPPRPPRASTIRSPLDSLPTPAPHSVRLSLGTWLASCLFPVIAITYALSRLADVRAHQRAIALIETPDATPVSLDRAVTVTIWIAIASLALPIVLEVVFAILMVKRLNWARTALLIVGLVAVPASLIAVDALSDDAALTNRNYVLIGIAVQALLVLVAAVLMYRPDANIWFRTRPQQTDEAS
jgi:hypothetical protein